MTLNEGELVIGAAMAWEFMRGPTTAPVRLRWPYMYKISHVCFIQPSLPLTARVERILLLSVVLARAPGSQSINVNFDRTILL